MIERTGNIFDTEAFAVSHGVNVDGRMGAGIAVQFKERFPEMHRQYVALCRARLLQPGEVFPYCPTPQHTIYNIASQDRPGRSARYEWVESGLEATVAHAQAVGHSLVALPQIGCGIGGLSIDNVRIIIQKVEEDTGVEFELWTYAP